MKYCSVRCNKRAWVVRKKKNLCSKFLIGTEEAYLKSASGKALFWEIWAAKKLGAIHLNAETMNQPSDLDLNGVKIDVKVAELWKRKMKRGRKTINISGTWCFHSETWNSSDLFLCIGLIDGQPIKIFQIPNFEMPKKGCTIGRYKSKYDKFLIKL